MNIVEELQRLDELIIEHTKPPVTATLRNQLSNAIEQCEAYQASSDRQDETLARQAETIERLTRENQALIAKQRKANRPLPTRAEDKFDYLRGEPLP